MGTVSTLADRAARANASGQRYVRVTNAHHRGFVEFQFSIGDPSMYLEMTLPVAAFVEFCSTHRVRHLDDDEARAVDAAELKWRFGPAYEE